MPHINHDYARQVRDRIAHHTMTIHLDDGDYRHLVFHNTTNQRPAEDSFHVVTWPHHAIIYGELCGAYPITTTNSDPLLELCSTHTINHRYWAHLMCNASPAHDLTRPTRAAATAWINTQVDELTRHHQLTQHDQKEITNIFEELRWEDGSIDWQDLIEVESRYYHTDNGENIRILDRDPYDYGPDLEGYTTSFLTACQALHHAANQYTHHHEKAHNK